MSLVPAFEIGVWNAWIFMVPFILANILCIFLMTKKDVPGGPSRVPTKSQTAFLFAFSSKIIYLPTLIYSFFLPLKLGTLWFYFGLPVTLLGLTGSIGVFVNWAIAPIGEPVTIGLYRYSRHPMYLTGAVVLLGVSILTASWIFLLFTIIFAIGVTRPYYIKIEEAQCIGYYRGAYKEYMARTPRWIGIPKSKL